MAEPLPRPVLLYDAECRLCRFAARVVARIDRRAELAILPLRTQEAARILMGVPEAERFATWRLVSRVSQTGFGSGGVELLCSMALTRPAGWLLDLVPDRALDAAYRFVAGNRRRLGRLVPDGPAPRRYP